MAVIDRWIQYISAALQTTFAYDFQIFVNTSVAVYQTPAGTTAPVLLTLTVDYTVTNVGVVGGGNIELVVGAALGDIITVVGVTPATRITTFTNAGDFQASSVNTEYTSQNYSDQQENRNLSRSISLHPADAAGDMVLPLAADRIHKYLKFDAAGDVDVDVASAGAPTDATYITKTPNASLDNEFAMSTLAGGIVRNTVLTGVPTIATEGVDYYGPAGTDIPITDGGTGASTILAAMDNLMPKQTQAIYVSKDGLDTNDGTNAQVPFLTIGAALTAAAIVAATGNRIVIYVMDGANYTENITLVQYVTVYAKNSALTGTIIGVDDSSIILKRHIVATGTVGITKNAGAGICGYEVIDFVTVGTGIGILNTSGEIHARVKTASIENGAMVGDASTDHIHYIGEHILITGTGVGIGRVNAGDVYVKVQLIQKTGAGTGTAILLTAGTINAYVTEIDTTVAYNNNGGTLNLICNKLTGTQTETAGTSNFFTNANYSLVKSASYITKTAEASLSGEFAMSALATGIVKNTTATGTPSIATLGTDYYGPGGTDVAVADGGTGASDAGTARTNLGLVIGTNVQAQDAGLQDIAGLAVTDSNIIVGDGTNWVAETGATARTSLGLTIGTDVQAYNAALADIVGLALTDSNIIVGDGTNWVAESGATARTSLGLGTTDAVSFTNGDFTGTEALKIPVGTTGERPGVPAEGDTRVNTTLATTEIYRGAAWVDLEATGVGLPAASQAEIETGTAVDKAISPGRAQYHKSAAKVWCECYDNAGTPTINSSYNIASLTDIAAGQVGYVFTTNFSSANYGKATYWGDSSTAYNSDIFIDYNNTQSAAQCSTRTFVGAGSADIDYQGIVLYGDQA